MTATVPTAEEFDALAARVSALEGADTTPPDPEPEPPPSGREVLVGPTRTLKQIADALDQAQEGDVIVVDDARYTRPGLSQVKGVTIRSRSGNPFACYFDGQGGMGGGNKLMWYKGGILCLASTNIEGIGFIGCGSPASGDKYSNEAGVYTGDTDKVTPVVVNLTRCAFDNNGNGAFAAEEGNVSVNVHECIFGYLAPNGRNAACGGGGGHPAHDLYLQCGEVNVTSSWFYGTQAGHNVKSRSPATYVSGNHCLTQDGGRALDVADGGLVRFDRNSVFTRTDRTSQPPPGTHGNANCVSYCGESTKHGTRDFQMADNVLHVSRMNSVVVAANGSRISASRDQVHLYGSGSLVQQGDVQGLASGLASGDDAPPLPPPPSWAVIPPATLSVRRLEAELGQLRQLLATVLPCVQPEEN